VIGRGLRTGLAVVLALLLAVQLRQAATLLPRLDGAALGLSAQLLPALLLKALLLAINAALLAGLLRRRLSPILPRDPSR
jgi:hypothetical protein